MSTPINCVGDNLIVGQITYPIQELNSIFPGRATINGPLIIGANAGGVPTANAMFGPGFTGLPSLESIGITNIYGQLNVAAISNVTGITNKFATTVSNALKFQNGLNTTNALSLGNDATVLNSFLTANGGIETLFIVARVCEAKIGKFTAVAAPFKQFNIKHPSKSGHRLIHACLEGPEVGVYYRGHLKGDNKIVLPEYWNNLINPESITVHFTPYRFYQELYVKSIEWGKIVHIVNNSGGTIDCDFIVYAERIDVPKLEIEPIDDGRIKI